jgi:GTP-sensing pleiotropic transcriptional regulator CodY
MRIDKGIRKKMKKKIVIGISIVSVVVIILASSSNIVGYQIVQATNQNIINKEVNQRELMFQTIVDLANNKEIQQIILKSQINRDGLFYLDEKFQILDNPPVTKNQIKQLYFIGLLFTRIINKSKMQSILEQNRFNNQEMQQEITAVIEKDATLDREVTQLLNSECDCDNEQSFSWDFPILCSILNVIMLIPLILFAFGSSLGALGLWFRLIGLIGNVIVNITVPIIYAIINVGTIFDCNWWFISP